MRLRAWIPNSVLQAGTAVLVDTFGVPRVRCSCGNPLAPAIELAAGVTVRGTPWPGFDLGNTVVVRAIEEVLEFDLNDILSSDRFIKPVGALAAALLETTTTEPATDNNCPRNRRCPGNAPLDRQRRSRSQRHRPRGIRDLLPRASIPEWRNA